MRCAATALLVEEAAGVHAAGHVRHAHAHEARHGARLVRGCRAHRVGLSSGDVRSSHSRVAHDRGLLQVLDHPLVLFGRGDRVHAEGGYLDAAQVGPLLGKHLVEGVGELGGVRGHGGVAHAHGGNLREGGLQRRQKLAFQLRVDLVARVGLLHVAAHVLVEQQRVGDLVRVLAVAAHRNIHVKADVRIDDAEGNRRCRAVLVADDLFLVEVIHALVFARVAAEGEAAAHALEGRLDAVGDFVVAKEQARLGRVVEHEFARLAACVDDCALFDDDHVLAVGHGDDRAVGDDVALALGVRRAALVGGALHALDHQRVGVEGVAVEIVAPRIGKHATQGARARFQKTHDRFLSVVLPDRIFARGARPKPRAP